MDEKNLVHPFGTGVKAEDVFYCRIMNKCAVANPLVSLLEESSKQIKELNNGQHTELTKVIDDLLSR